MPEANEGLVVGIPDPKNIIVLVVTGILGRGTTQHIIYIYIYMIIYAYIGVLPGRFQRYLLQYKMRSCSVHFFHDVHTCFKTLQLQYPERPSTFARPLFKTSAQHLFQAFLY